MRWTLEQLSKWALKFLGTFLRLKITAWWVPQFCSSVDFWPVERWQKGISRVLAEWVCQSWIHEQNLNLFSFIFIIQFKSIFNREPFQWWLFFGNMVLVPEQFIRQSFDLCVICQCCYGWYYSRRLSNIIICQKKKTFISRNRVFLSKRYLILLISFNLNRQVETLLVICVL